MARMTIELPDDLNKEFRAEVARKFGGKKGSLGRAIEEAIKLWLEKEEEG